MAERTNESSSCGALQMPSFVQLFTTPECFSGHWLGAQHSRNLTDKNQVLAMTADPQYRKQGDRIIWPFFLNTFLLGKQSRNPGLGESLGFHCSLKRELVY